jgi:hypothetical protein
MPELSPPELLHTANPISSIKALDRAWGTVTGARNLSRAPNICILLRRERHCLPSAFAVPAPSAYSNAYLRNKLRHFSPVGNTAMAV